MEDYLKGYLDVLPEVERRKVKEIVRSNQDLFDNEEFSEEEFERAIRQLVDSHKQTTEYLPQVDQLDSKKHNEFFRNMYMDLSLLFIESDLIDNGVNSYDRLYEGILSDLQREIFALQRRIESLRLTSESENGIIVKSFDFSNDKDMEVPGEGNKYLFLDRDGTDIDLVHVEHNDDIRCIKISKTSQNDRLRDEKGNVTAFIEIVDRRGNPVQHPGQNIYSIDKAIDNSVETYWGEVILSEKPINIKMTK